jgi:hypothetical protein
LSIEPIREIIEGHPACGGMGAVLARGPEILLASHTRDGWVPLLAHTQLRSDEIDWIKVVSNWGLPWPAGKDPRPSEY